ncbi:formylglycine-generating enzyme family protein [Treponema sp. R80B11-R83G3]
MKKTIKWQFINKIAIIVTIMTMLVLTLTACKETETHHIDTINISAIQGVNVVYGNAPVSTITENGQYSGTVTWSPNHERFTAAQYTATITLTPKQGYTLQGVAANFFTLEGATSVNNAANSSIITAVFPAFLEIDMVQIPGGSFQMGSNDDNTEQPVHTVTLSGFQMGKYEVTQEQWTAVMGSNPSYFTSSPASGEEQGKRPVENVSWYNALVFCNKLSMMEELSPAYRISGSTDPANWGSVPTSNNNSTWDAVQIVAGSNGYRLPTEAQWEYAAKGGNGSPGNYTYSGSDTAGDVAWYGDNSSSKTHEVGKKVPNGLGLYDMSGNVWEWCWDYYVSYSSGAQTDPLGASSGNLRVERGGSWHNSAESVRSSSRYYYYPSSRYHALGFRLVRP